MSDVPFSARLPDPGRQSRWDDICESTRYLSGQITAAELAAASEHFRSRADEAFQLHGLRAPQIHAGEELAAYRRRLLRGLQPHCDESLRKVKVTELHHSTLPPLEKLMFADSVAAFKQPVGELREASYTDPYSGQRQVRFFGDPENTWAPFKCPLRRGHVTYGMGRGAHAPGACVVVAELMSDGSTRRVR